VKLGANIEDRSAALGDTALFGAVSRGNAQAARWLIEKGADVHATNRKLETPLHAAASVECVDLLLNAGGIYYYFLSHPPPLFPILDAYILAANRAM